MDWSSRVAKTCSSWMWVLVAVACGPTVAAPDGATTADGSGTTVGAEAGDTAVAPDLGVGEVDSTAAPIDCHAFDDEAAEGNPVAIEIHNVGDEPILLDAPCFGYDYLAIETTSGAYWPGGFCATTCQEELVFGCFDCDGCASSAYTVVNPGEHAEVRWPGVLFETQTPPRECYQVDPCSDACPRKRLPTDEIMTVSVEAITHADCVAAEQDPAVCDCPRPGGCENYGSTQIQPTLFATIDADPLAPGPIVLEIEG